MAARVGGRDDPIEHDHDMPAQTPSALAAALLLGSLVSAQDQTPAQRASALRDVSVEAWRAKDYRTASDKLQQADAIYRELGDEHVPDRAVVCRAIIWNEVDDEQLATAFDWLSTLAELAAQHDGVGHELGNGYSAFATGVARLSDVGQRVEWTGRARSLFRRLDHRLLAAQCLHDEGSAHADADQLVPMRKAYERAIAERRRLGDDDGLAWSANNIAYHVLRFGRVHEALEPLETALSLHDDGRAGASQAAAATNLRTLSALLRDTDQVGAKEERWYWTRAQRAVESTASFVVPPEQVVRRAAELAVRRAKKTNLDAVFRRARALASDSWSAEASADLVLRLAESGLEHGDGADAVVGLLADLARSDALTKGPCAPHLAARYAALRAHAAAAVGDEASYARFGDDAVARVDELGDFALRRAVLERLATAPIERSAARERFAAASSAARRQGEPGGRGGFAISEAVGVMPDDAGPHTAVFEVRWDGESQQVVFEDLFGGSSWSQPVEWEPRTFSYNGVSFSLHGGYLCVRRVDYAGGGGVDGSPAGGTLLDALGNYLPIPAEGSIRVLRNTSVLRKAR